MKKRIKRFGAFALLVLAGLMFAGCSKSDSSKNQESDDKSFFGGRNPIDELLSFVDDLIPKYAPQDTPILGDWNSQNGLYSFRNDYTFAIRGFGQDLAEGISVDVLEPPFTAKGTWSMADDGDLIITYTHMGNAAKTLDELPQMDNPITGKGMINFTDVGTWEWDSGDGWPLVFITAIASGPHEDVPAASARSNTSGQRVQVTCFQCNGTGTWTSSSSSGTPLSDTCMRCNGSGKAWITRHF